MRHRLTRVAAVAIVAAGPAAFADEVFLRGGGSIHGEVVQQTPAALVMEVGPGRMTLPMSRVERIVSATSDLSVYRARAARLAAGDVAGWIALARWAEERELLTQSRDAYQRALALDPGNAAANEALGRVRLAGRWVTAEDAYRARGYVPFEGSWVSPEERSATLAERAAEVQARERTAEAEARAREAEARADAAEADARRAEAAVQAQGTGIPYPYVYGSGAIYGGGLIYGPGGQGGHRHRGQGGRTTPPPPTPMPAVKPTSDQGSTRSDSMHPGPRNH